MATARVELTHEQIHANRSEVVEPEIDVRGITPTWVVEDPADIENWHRRLDHVFDSHDGDIIRFCLESLEMSATMVDILRNTADLAMVGSHTEIVDGKLIVYPAHRAGHRVAPRVRREA